MKKTTFFIALLLLIITAVSAQKAQTQPFNKIASEEFSEQDGRYNVYLDAAEDFVLTTIKYDTTRTANGKGYPIREVVSTTTKVIIRKGEKGVFEWETDNMGWATFATVEKQGLKLPFVSSGSGKGNGGNGMILKTDSTCGYQYGHIPIPCKPSARIITLGSADDEDLATYKFDGQKPKLVYKPIFKNVKKNVKVKSNGKKAN